MRIIKLFFCLIIALVTCKAVNAQDPHNSQYFNLPVYYNPAAAGQGVENIRLTALYRNQWPSLGNAFTTEGIQFDKQVSRVGFGAVILKNAAGPSSISRLQFGGTISYRLKFGMNQLAAGINIGLIQKSFDPSQMTFDDQYIDDAGYSSGNPTEEMFAYTKVTRPDVGGGLLWTIGEEKNSRWQPYAGASMQHINKAKEVFIETENTNPVKTVFQLGTKYNVNEKVELKPSAMFAQQQFSNELLYGCMATLKFQDKNKVQAGLYMRKNESAIIYTGYQWSSLMVGASYDMNFSRSVNQSGAFELTLTYIPKAKVKKDKKPKEKTEKDPLAPEQKIVEEKNAIEKTDKDSSAAEAKSTELKSKETNTIAAEPPTNDRDKDGIKDKDDKCPDEPGLTSNKGCPLSGIDADGDGVPNITDDCPYIRGSIKTNGCPDMDEDGIIDSKDRCPTEKGLAKDNGCPDKPTGERWDNRAPYIKFKINETTINGFDVIDILEPVSDQLYSDPSLHILVTGHTDAEGDEQYNMILSQNRADAVKYYFMKHGVSEDRITTVGYGESMPLHSNETELGRAGNRRAEIYIRK